MIALIASPALAQSPGTGDEVYSELIQGDWQGTLEYRDYSSDKRVTLPTTLKVESKPDRSVVFRFRYDEGRGRFVEGSETIRIDPVAGTYVSQGETAKDRSEYQLSGFPEFARKGKGGFVLTGTGNENDQMVEVRKTITILDGRFTILKETRIPGQTFLFRNQYTFRRPEKPGA